MQQLSSKVYLKYPWRSELTLQQNRCNHRCHWFVGSSRATWTSLSILYRAKLILLRFATSAVTAKSVLCGNYNARNMKGLRDRSTRKFRPSNYIFRFVSLILPARLWLHFQRTAIATERVIKTVAFSILSYKFACLPQPLSTYNEANSIYPLLIINFRHMQDTCHNA